MRKFASQSIYTKLLVIDLRQLGIDEKLRGGGGGWGGGGGGGMGNNQGVGYMVARKACKGKVTTSLVVYP